MYKRQLPSSYAVMDEEEMSYLEGGGTAVVYGTASQIRSRPVSYTHLDVYKRQAYYRIVGNQI